MNFKFDAKEMASFAIPFLFLFLSLPTSLSAANMTLSSSITTDKTSLLSSPSGDFAFGFRPLNNSDLFMLAIWFDNIPDKTIVWQANGDNPVPTGSKVQLTASSLLLTDPTGLMIWEAKTSTTVSYGAVLDTGNFVLASNDSTIVWESFNNPTDTILPTQILNFGSMLFSRLTDTNFSKGRFELHLSNGSLELNPTAWPTEYQYESYYSVSASGSTYQLVFNESGDIYILQMNGEILQLTPWGPLSIGSDYYYRATLDPDGVFTEYAYQKQGSTNQNWSPVRSIPVNICIAITSDLGSGACGYNSYCTIQNSKPSCNCPDGYVLTDPNNVLGGCTPTFAQGCGLGDFLTDPEEVYEMRELPNVNWPLGDYERLWPYNQTQCENSCLQDCSCAVAIFNGATSTCWKKRLPLSNGRSESDGVTRALIKVRKGAISTSPENVSGKTVVLKSLLVVSTFFIFILLVASSVLVFNRLKAKPHIGVQDSSSSDKNLKFFPYKVLEEATKNFEEELGRGAFGTVYKGILKVGATKAVAVKKLEKLSGDMEREFKAEVNAISRIHHKNLVQLLGYCDEGPHRLLVYDLMSNGSLENYLFSLPKPDWNQRVRIVLGIARGLLYLHEECEVPIMHCDVKPSNILLDDHFSAKISDFGTAKLLLSNHTRTSTMIRGTRGYVAPEWFKNVPVTPKVDVYSFGVMLLEVICCRRSVVMELEGEEKAILTDWAYDCYVEGRLDLLVDVGKAAVDDKERLQKWVMIAIWCIQEDPSKRPAMKIVLEMLEDFVEVPSPPRPCPFSSFQAENQS